MSSVSLSGSFQIQMDSWVPVIENSKGFTSRNMDTLATLYISKVYNSVKHGKPKRSVNAFQSSKPSNALQPKKEDGKFHGGNDTFYS